jgi:hypothetical protein
MKPLVATDQKPTRTTSSLRTSPRCMHTFPNSLPKHVVPVKTGTQNTRSTGTATNLPIQVRKPPTPVFAYHRRTRQHKKYMPKAKSTDNSSNLGLEAKLWLAADKLRNDIGTAEYKQTKNRRNT